MNLGTMKKTLFSAIALAFALQTSSTQAFYDSNCGGCDNQPAKRLTFKEMVAFEHGKRAVQFAVELAQHVGQGTFCANINTLVEQGRAINGAIEHYEASEFPKKGKHWKQATNLARMFTRGAMQRIVELPIDDIIKKSCFAPGQGKILKKIHAFYHNYFGEIVSLNDDEIPNYIDAHQKQKADFFASLQSELKHEMPNLGRLQEVGPLEFLEGDSDDEANDVAVKSYSDAYKKGKDAGLLLFKILSTLGQGCFFDTCDDMLREVFSFGVGLFFCPTRYHMDVLKGVAKGLQKVDIDAVIKDGKLTDQQAMLLRKIFARLRDELGIFAKLNGEELEERIQQKKPEYSKIFNEIKFDIIKTMPALADFIADIEL